MGMRCEHVIAGSAALLVVLAGCAAEDIRPTAGAGPSALPASSALAIPSPTHEPGGSATKPDAAHEVPKRQMDTSALPEGYPRKAKRNEAGDGLLITAQEGGCGKASAELVKQTSSEVVVLLVHTVPKDDTTLCTMDIRYPEVPVKLAEPLGERMLVLKAEERQE